VNLLEKFLQLFHGDRSTESVSASQARRRWVTEKRILDERMAHHRHEASPNSWDGTVFRRQNRVDAQPGTVIARPFSRLDNIEQGIRARQG
jgi:hypothetical protein